VFFVKNALLQTAFSAILPTGQRQKKCTIDFIEVMVKCNAFWLFGLLQGFEMPRSTRMHCTYHNLDKVYYKDFWNVLATFKNISI